MPTFALALAALVHAADPAAAPPAAPAAAPSVPSPPAASAPPAAPSVPSPPAASAPPAASSVPSPPAASAPPPAPAAPVERGTVLEEVSGKVAAIDRRAHRLEVETPSGPVTLVLDRNTMVYTAKGLGTVLDVAPGAQIRAGRNADFLAYWVQVRAPPRTAPAAEPAGGATPPR